MSKGKGEAMDKGCLYCQHYDTCEVIKSLARWQKERQLEIENTRATWVIDSMVCNLFSRDESIGEDVIMLQDNGVRYEPD